VRDSDARQDGKRSASITLGKSARDKLKPKTHGKLKAAGVRSIRWGGLAVGCWSFQEHGCRRDLDFSEFRPDWVD